MVRGAMPMARRWSTALAILSLAACGGDDAPTQQAAGPLTACTAYGAAFCSALEKCDPSRFEFFYGPASACPVVQAANCRKATTGPGVIVTNAMVQSCADALSTSACGASVDACAWPTGSLGKDAPCAAHLGCASGHCDGGELFCGKCTDPTRSAEGGPCALIDGAKCAAGLYCDAGICKKPVAVGDACTTASCPEGTSCNGGTCKPLVKLGDACTTIFDCAEGVCDVTGKKVCVPLKPKQSGESCGASVTSLCASGLQCLIKPSTPNKCIPSGLPGEECLIGTSEPCMGDFHCDENGICAPRPLLSCGG